MPRFTLIATLRNEGPYVLEWVAHHRLIGFTKLVVCSNDCVDETPRLLDLLARRGLLTHLACAPGPQDKPQLFAYARAREWLDARAGGWASGADWAMVLDGDEFLNIHVGAGRLDDLVAAAPGATALLINWRVFGDSGHAAWSAEGATRRFTRAARIESAVNLSFKTLFRHADAYRRPVLPHGPGFARAERLAELRPVDGAGEPLGEAFARAEGFLQSAPGSVSWRLAQVNHYNTRSFEDYLVKHDRGGGLSWERWDRDWNWRAFNTNEAEDLSIQRDRVALDAALAALLQDEEIAAQHRRCCDLYGAHVAALRAAA